MSGRFAPFVQVRAPTPLPARRHVRNSLASGIAVTLAANVSAGLAHGFAGALWAAWPTAALVGSYEALMYLVRAAAGASAGQAETAPIAASAGPIAGESPARSAGTNLRGGIPSHPRTGGASLLSPPAGRRSNGTRGDSPCWRKSRR